MTGWDTRYDRPDYLFGTKPAAPLKHVRARLPQGGRALCVADGEGRNSVWLAQQGFDVTAFDASAVALAKARRLADARGATVDLHEGDILTWDWDAPGYDLVAAIFIQFTPPPERALVFDGLVRALKPGGTLYLLGYTPEQVGRGTGGPPHASHMYTEDLLRDAFAVLAFAQLRRFEADLDEGAGHSGPSALIEMLARKPL